MGTAVRMAVVMAGDMVAAVEEVLEGIMVATVMAMAMVMAIMADMVTVGGVILIGGVIPIDGVIRTGEVMGRAGGVTLIGGAIPTGGVTLTIPLMVPTMIPTTFLILTKAMEGRRCLQKRLLPRRNRERHLLIGTSARTQRATTLT